MVGTGVGERRNEMAPRECRKERAIKSCLRESQGPLCRGDIIDRWRDRAEGVRRNTLT